MMNSKAKETLPSAHITIEKVDSGFIIRRASDYAGMMAAETRVAYVAESAVDTAVAMFSAHMHKWLAEQGAHVTSGQRD